MIVKKIWQIVIIKGSNMILFSFCLIINVGIKDVYTLCSSE